jgi:hypothetical protein
MSAPIQIKFPEKPLAPDARLTRFNAYEWQFRIFIVVMLGVSVLLSWWSLKRLVPLQRQCRELSATVSRVSTEVDEMQRQWSEDDAAQIRRRFAQANAQLFVDQSALESWMANLKDQVIPLGLDVHTDFAKSVPQSSHNDLAIIPTTVAVDVRPTLGIQGAESSYQRILRLSHRLTTQQKRADLAELKVSATSDNSINGAVLVLNLWAGEEQAE